MCVMEMFNMISKQLPSGHHAASHTFHNYVENIGKVSKRDYIQLFFVN